MGIIFQGQPPLKENGEHATSYVQNAQDLRRQRHELGNLQKSASFNWLGIITPLWKTARDQNAGYWLPESKYVIQISQWKNEKKELCSNWCLRPYQDASFFGLYDSCRPILLDVFQKLLFMAIHFGNLRIKLGRD
jgi:hypothetical protein